ncbi:hypothetical protein HD806DRAFT_489231 [Xylariaceae sp. AK1471]|nr:hypothetical protein HD806DRAFT_489231 [Xylariaceae sp. AK1471]
MRACNILIAVFASLATASPAPNDPTSFLTSVVFEPTKSTTTTWPTITAWTPPTMSASSTDPHTGISESWDHHTRHCYSQTHDPFTKGPITVEIPCPTPA